MDVQAIKRTFGIIGNDPELDRAIGIAAQVAATDLTVLITGESGTGKDVFPKIIHQNSARKHGQYFAVNCGAIPEGTIDSELFGHEKGSFTGAVNERKGYFEIADKGIKKISHALSKLMPNYCNIYVSANIDGPVWYVKVENGLKQDHEYAIQIVDHEGYLNINSLDEGNVENHYTSTHLFIRKAES